MRNIGEIIKDREPYSVEADWTVRKVVSFLYEKKVGAVAVMDNGKVAGVFSERDLLRRVVNEGLDPDATVVRDIMSSGVISIRPEDDYRVAKAEMFDRGIRHLVVLGAEGELLGIVSMRELMEVDLAEYMEIVARLNDRYYQMAEKQ